MPQNSTSDGRIGWVSSGDGRNTSDILWSCFSVFLVCTWSCLHLNVPSIEESEAGWLKWHGIPYWPEKPLLRKWSRKVLWMGAIIIAPEVGVAMAMRDFLDARRSLAACKPENSMGFVGREEENTDTAKPSKMTESHAFLANMGRFNVKLYPCTGVGSVDGTSVRSPREGIVLKYEGLEYLSRVCRDLHIPDEEDVKALSKRNEFTKTFAIVQSTWLVIQSIARASVGLPITQLELATIAFVVCGIFMYALWWNKPYGVERRELLVATLDGEALYAQSWTSNVRFKDLDNRNWRALYGNLRVKQPNILDLLAISSSLTPLAGAQTALYIGGTVFSAFHILAWNWEFPNNPAKIVWRVLAITATCVGPVLFFMMSLIGRWDDLETFLVLVICGIFAVYSISRVGLIVLIFYCFSSMPVDVYKTVEWTKFLPHFA